MCVCVCGGGDYVEGLPAEAHKAESHESQLVFLQNRGGNPSATPPFYETLHKLSQCCLSPLNCIRSEYVHLSFTIDWV